MSQHVGTYTTRAARVRAMRVIIGATTRADIRRIAPNANVGGPTLNDDETDLRWISLMSAPEGHRDVQHDGDWLVDPGDGVPYVLSDKEFNERFVKA